MSSPLIRLIRDEMFSRNIQVIPSSRIGEVRGLVEKAFLGLDVGDARSRVIVRDMVANLEQDAEMLSRTRLVKTVLGGEELPGSFDREVLELAKRLVKAEQAILSAKNIVLGNKYLVLFTSDCRLDDIVFRKGDIALLTQAQLIKGVLQDCLVTLKHPIVEYSDNVG
ncbi:MAG: hypothetical protein ACPLSM_06910 [Thermosphaera sp.]